MSYTRTKTLQETSGQARPCAAPNREVRLSRLPRPARSVSRIHSTTGRSAACGRADETANGRARKSVRPRRCAQSRRTTDTGGLPAYTIRHANDRAASVNACEGPARCGQPPPPVGRLPPLSGITRAARDRRTLPARMTPQEDMTNLRGIDALTRLAKTDNYRAVRSPPFDHRTLDCRRLAQRSCRDVLQAGGTWVSSSPQRLTDSRLGARTGSLSPGFSHNARSRSRRRPMLRGSRQPRCASVSDRSTDCPSDHRVTAHTSTVGARSPRWKEFHRRHAYARDAVSATTRTRS